MSTSPVKGSDLAAQLSNYIKGKVVLTTGVSPQSLGAQFVKTISRHQPKLLILAGRDVTKLQKTKEDLEEGNSALQVRLLQLDLASQAQIKEAAEQVNAYPEAIDVLVNNAGVMAAPYGKTAEGIEMQFGSNHIGHFLFTNLIMGKLGASTAGGRVVNISSNGYRLGPVRFEDYNFQDGAVYDKWRAYGQSKSANMLFSAALAKRGHTSFSVHPGVIQTNLSSGLQQADFEELARLSKQDGNLRSAGGLVFKTIDEGTASHIYAAFHPDIERQSGSYVEECAIVPPERVNSWARDAIEAEKLWKLSERLVGQPFPR